MVSDRDVGGKSDGYFGNNTSIGVGIIGLIMCTIFIVFPDDVFFERLIGVNGA
jgi:hypothetical protein